MGTTVLTSSPHRAGLWLVAGLCACLAWSAGAQEQDLPATQDAFSSTQPMPIDVAADVEQALRLSDREKQILASVRDGNSQLDEAGLYVTLRRAAMLPVGQATLDKADSVPVDNLLARPERYRGQLIRMDVRVWRVQKWQSELTPTIWWGRRPIWRLDCTIRGAGRDDPSAGVPVMLLLTQLPEGYREGEFRTGPSARVAGLFYKTVQLRKDGPQGEGSPESRLYAVLAGNALYASQGSDAGDGLLSSPMTYIIAGLLLLMVVGFIFARRMAARRPVRPWRQYASPQTGESQELADGPVDEELARQVRQFQQEHGIDPDQPSKETPDESRPG